MSTEKSIELDSATFVIRDDGRIGVYSPAGYQIVEIDQLPTDIRKPVMALAKMQKEDKS
jgi:hypothetical protein